MQSKKIEESETLNLKVSALPTRPTASSAFGGRGYTAAEMKAAFDKFPEFILEKLNLLIDDLLREGEDSYVGGFQTGIKENYSLKNLIDGILSGEFANLLKVNGKSLASVIAELEDEILELRERSAAAG